MMKGKVCSAELLRIGGWSPGCPGYAALFGLQSSHMREQHEVCRTGSSQSPLCCLEEPEGQEKAKTKMPTSRTCSHKPTENERRGSHATEKAGSESDSELRWSKSGLSFSQKNKL